MFMLNLAIRVGAQYQPLLLEYGQGALVGAHVLLRALQPKVAVVAIVCIFVRHDTGQSVGPRLADLWQIKGEETRARGPWRVSQRLALPVRVTAL